MVIELVNGTKVTLGANDVESLTFTSDALSISGNTINDILDRISKLEEKVFPPVEVITINNVSFKMVKVVGGTFQMGKSADGYDETPVHSVTLSDYYIGETEVTQALWYTVMGQKPTPDGPQWEEAYCIGDDYPAYRVSWYDCQEFITKLNELTGKTFRMPTEAEWEYAAKGGNKSQSYIYSGSNIVGDVAWYSPNSSNKTHPVATKTPNELNLYDMSGNVYEWCSDWYDSYINDAQTNPTGATSGVSRVLRGGGSNDFAPSCRVVERHFNTPEYRTYRYGLRLVLDYKIIH